MTTFNFLNSDARYVAGGFIPPADIAKELSERDALAHESMMKQLIENENDPDNRDVVLPGSPLEMAKLAVGQLRKRGNAESSSRDPDQYSSG